MYALVDDETGQTLGRFEHLSGFFVGRPDGNDSLGIGSVGPVQLGFEIKGISVGEDALLTLRAKGRKNLVVQVLSSDLVPIGEYYVASAAVDLPKGGHLPGSANLIDLNVDGYLNWLPRREAKAIWGSWAEARPDRKGLWVNLPLGSREAWLEVAGLYAQTEDQSNQSRVDTIDLPDYFMNGAHVEDLASFFCALGEAINGPGGYYGWNMAALADLLKSDSRSRAPFTLHWSDFDVAGIALSARVAADGRTALDLVLECLSEAGVVVMRE